MCRAQPRSVWEIRTRHRVGKCCARSTLPPPRSARTKLWRPGERSIGVSSTKAVKPAFQNQHRRQLVDGFAALFDADPGLPEYTLSLNGGKAFIPIFDRQIRFRFDAISEFPRVAGLAALRSAEMQGETDHDPCYVQFVSQLREPRKILADSRSLECRQALRRPPELIADGQPDPPAAEIQCEDAFGHVYYHYSGHDAQLTAN